MLLPTGPASLGPVLAPSKRRGRAWEEGNGIMIEIEFSNIRLNFVYFSTLAANIQFLEVLL
jgi:hypothetical protein